MKLTFDFKKIFIIIIACMIINSIIIIWSSATWLQATAISTVITIILSIQIEKK